MIHLRNENLFKCAGRSDNVLLESELLTPCPANGYTSLYNLLNGVKLALVAEGSNDPAVLTFNAVVALMQTQAEVLKVVAPF